MGSYQTWLRRFTTLHRTQFQAASDEALEATEEATHRGQNSAAREVGFDPFTEPDPRAVRVAEERMSAGIQRVNGDMRRGITTAVQEGLREGVRQEGITELIQNAFQGEAWRVPVIARTELNWAANHGRLAAYRQSSEVVGKEWVTAGDDRVRPSHTAIDGETRRKHEQFSLGVQAPPAAPNCRCSVIPVTNLSAFRLAQDEQASTELVPGLTTLTNRTIQRLTNILGDIETGAIEFAMEFDLGSDRGATRAVIA